MSETDDVIIKQADLVLIFVTLSLGLTGILAYIILSVRKKASLAINNEQLSVTDEVKNESQPKENKGTKQRKVKSKYEGKKSQAFSHPWLACSLKGHGGKVLSVDFSPNRKYLLTSSIDRSVLIWRTKEFESNEIHNIRLNVQLDHLNYARFTPDNKNILGLLALERTIRIFRLGKTDDGTPKNFSGTFDFPKGHHSNIFDFVGFGVANNGRFIMTCTSDTSLVVWSTKGDVLSDVDTGLGNNSFAMVSPCGRFIGACGFTSDVKVWEVKFDKNGEYKGVFRAFELKGHTAGVFGFDFDSNSSRMVSISKDSTWKFWDTNIQFGLGQDPILLKTGNYTINGPSLVALSPNSLVVAISSGRTIYFYDANTGKLDKVIDDVSGDDLGVLCFDANSKYLVVSGDKHVHVFHNITGYKALINDNKTKLQNAPKSMSSIMKQRLSQEIEQAKQFLSSYDS